MEEYVYEGQLVRKTGRLAVKQTQNTKRRSSTRVSVDNSLYEIEPVGTDITWTKWVKDTDLYLVEQDGF